jgi:hypothetical protein
VSVALWAALFGAVAWAVFIGLILIFARSGRRHRLETRTLHMATLDVLLQAPTPEPGPAETLYAPSPREYVRADKHRATLDGTFTAFELQAIAAWMIACVEDESR